MQLTEVKVYPVNDDEKLKAYVRITSYNVCYTKLLRDVPSSDGVCGRGERGGGGSRRRAEQRRKNHLIQKSRVVVLVLAAVAVGLVVITSYSIHYTKLYEGLCARGRSATF